MEAFGSRTVLVAAALHALLSKSQGGSLREIADEAVTVADECLDLMGVQRKKFSMSLQEEAKLADAATIVSFCRRKAGHEGPCNGMPRKQCPGYPKESTE